MPSHILADVLYYAALTEEILGNLAKAQQVLSHVIQLNAEGFWGRAARKHLSKMQILDTVA